MRLMFLENVLIAFALMGAMIDSTHINLYLTDGFDQREGDQDALAYHCLRTVARMKNDMDPHQIISYCLTSWPSAWNISPNRSAHKFSFTKLNELGVTSEQLHLWSAPIDLVEEYQSYVDHDGNADIGSLATRLFYNCTSPNFGPICQYSFDLSRTDGLSLNEIIYAFYRIAYSPTRLTCYIHLKCNRGSSEACLHWTEICDGYVDCLNDGVDEKHCWELEINECAADEYRCDNGQCIAKIFLYDAPDGFECLDRSDALRNLEVLPSIPNGEPTINRIDVTCNERFYRHGTKLSSSCVYERDELLQFALLAGTPSTLSDKCWLAFRCYNLMLSSTDPRCPNECPRSTCKQILDRTCPDIIRLPDEPLAFGHVYLIFNKSDVLYSNAWRPPSLVCYNPQLCSEFASDKSLSPVNNMTCHRPKDIPLTFKLTGKANWRDFYVRTLYEQLSQCNTIIYDQFITCDGTHMYQCRHSSKCISIYRRCDGIVDCDERDDEECTIIDGACSTLRPDLLFQCKNTNQCISLKRVEDKVCDCGFDESNLCDDETSEIDFIRKRISFPTICDGLQELKPQIIDGRNESDETECQHWQCNNTYTRCDGTWNCLNGADEADCDSSPLLACPPRHHLCVSPENFRLSCLPISKAGDGHVDCLGGTDEPHLCRLDSLARITNNFYCRNDSLRSCIPSSKLCNGNADCAHGDDELFCTPNTNRSATQFLCDIKQAWSRSDVENFLCQRPMISRKLNRFTSLSMAEKAYRSLSEMESLHLFRRSSITVNSAATVVYLYESRLIRIIPHLPASVHQAFTVLNVNTRMNA